MAKRQIARPAPTSTQPAVRTSVEPPEPMNVSARGPKVRATDLLYYGLVRRRVGDVFRLQDEQHFNPKCMERVSQGTPETVTGPNAALRIEHDRIIGAKSPDLIVPPESGIDDTGGNPLDVD